MGRGPRGVELTAAQGRLFSLAALLAGAAAAAAYANALHGAFVMDDDVAVVKNADLRPETPWHALFRNDYWGTPLHTEDSHKSYRPLAVLTFRWNYAFGGLSVAGYHAVNVALHTAATVLAAFAARRVAENDLVAASTALLFATHPVHAEAVTGVVGRAEVLSAVFFFSGFLLFDAGARPASTSVPLVAAAGVCSVVAMLCKETGVTLLGVCVAYDLVSACFMWDHPMRAKLRHLILRATFLISLLVVCLLARKRITGTSFGPTFSNVDNHLYFAESTLARGLSYAWLHVRYAWILLWPVTLSCDYSFNAVKIVRSLSDPRVAAAAALYTFVITVTALAIRARSRTMLMGLAFAGIPFVPSSNVFFPVATVIGERLLYLPSFGYSLLLAHWTDVALRRHRHAAWTVISVVAALYAARTLARNQDWDTPIRLFSAAQLAVPSSCKAHICAAAAFNNRGMLDRALESVDFALAVKPDYAGAHYVRGNIFNKLPDQNASTERLALDAYAMAVDTSEEDTEFKPDVLGVALNNIGSILLRRRDDPEAMRGARRAFVRSLQVSPGRFSAHANLAEVMSVQGQFAGAQYHYEQALALDGASAKLWNNLGIAKYRRAAAATGNKDPGPEAMRAALQCYERALALEQDFAAAWENVAKVHYHQKNYTGAAEAYSGCTRAEADHASCWHGLGKALLRLGRAQDALDAFNAAGRASQPMAPGEELRFRANRDAALQLVRGAEKTGADANAMAGKVQ